MDGNNSMGDGMINGNPFGFSLRGQPVIIPLGPNRSCIHVDINSASSFIDQVGSINFFKRPAQVINATIRTNKNVYMTGEQVNVTVSV